MFKGYSGAYRTYSLLIKTKFIEKPLTNLNRATESKLGKWVLCLHCAWWYWGDFGGNIINVAISCDLIAHLKFSSL